MKILLLTTSILFAAYTISQTTLIPDANFEQKLIDLGYDTGTPDGSVPTANINTVTSLSVGSSNISDLTGIQDFIALRDLYCSYNQLTFLDVSQNTALVYLGCSSNQLTSLDVSLNTNLEFLYCSVNQIPSLDVSQNTQLISLTCIDNQLTSLDVSQNTALKDFSCSANQISSLDVTQNTGLEIFFCNGNLLSSIDVTQNTDLRIFYCDANQISSLDVSQNTALTQLSFPENQITSIDVSQNIFLWNLRFFSNQLTSLDLSQNPEITDLICYDNQLECLNVKNGNNTSITSFSAYDNPNLTCISVDDALWSIINWTNKDPQSTFSENCNNSCALSINEMKNNSTKKLSKIVDLTGREINYQENTLMIYIYEDGSSEKIFVHQ